MAVNKPSEFVKPNKFDPLDPIYTGQPGEVTNKSLFELLQALSGAIQTIEGAQEPLNLTITNNSIAVDRYRNNVITTGTLSTVSVVNVNGGPTINVGGIVELVLKAGTTVTNSSNNNGIQTLTGANFTTESEYIMKLVRIDGRWQEVEGAGSLINDLRTYVEDVEATANSARTTAINALPKSGGTAEYLNVTSNLYVGGNLWLGNDDVNVLNKLNENTSAINTAMSVASGALPITGGAMTGELIGRSDTDLPTSFIVPNRPNTLYSCQYSFSGDDDTGAGATRTYNVGQRMSYAGLSGYTLPAFEILSNMSPFSSIVKIHNELGVAVGTDNYVNLSDVKSIANTADANASSALTRLLELVGLMVQGETISVGGRHYINIYDIPSADNVVLRNGNNSMTGPLDMGAGYQGVNDKLSVPIKFNGRTDRNPYHDIKIRAVYNVASDTSLLEFYNDTGGFLNYLQIRATGISGNNFATTVPAPRPTASAGLGQILNNETLVPSQDTTSSYTVPSGTWVVIKAVINYLYPNGVVKTTYPSIDFSHPLVSGGDAIDFVIDSDYAFATIPTRQISLWRVQ